MPPRSCPSGTFSPTTISGQLHLVTALTMLSIVILAAFALQLANRTRSAAKSAFAPAIDAVRFAADLELDLERHRRIIEAAPAAVDRSSLAQDRSLSRAIGDDVIKALATVSGPDVEDIKRAVSGLIERGDRVIDYAHEFAQDKASEEARNYAGLANAISASVGRFREARTYEANESVNRLSRLSASTEKWAIGAALLALIMSGPVAIFIIGSLAHRIGSVTVTMLKLSGGDTAVGIPAMLDSDEIGDIARAVAVFKNNAISLTEQKDEIATLNHWLEIALNNMNCGLSMFDLERRLLLCNRLYAEIYRLSPELTQDGTHIHQILAHRDQVGTGRAEDDEVNGDLENSAGRDFSTWIGDIEATLTANSTATFTHKLQDGRTIYLHMQRLDGGGWVSIHVDVTERQAVSERMLRLASSDTLTGVDNRHSFMEKLGRNFSDLKSGRSVAVHLIDLDRFKAVNDTLGHPVGDELLCQVSARLKRTVRSEDVVARLGGDEFAVIQTSVDDPLDAEILASRLVGALSQPYFIDGKMVVIGASIGIACGPDDGTDSANVLKTADVALYRAKAGGRGRSIRFRREFEAEDLRAREVQNDLREALALGQIELQYQPIIGLDINQVTAFEALVRWRHPVRGVISPGDFIPAAEECGLIVELGQYAVERACQDAATWPGHIKVSVNLSPVQFRRPGFYETLVEAISLADLAPQRLELEITESLMLNEAEATLDVLHKLKALGVGITLDDFGTGYASLSYLTAFPFDKIKIDQTFVRDLPARPDCAAIVGAVVDLARRLGILTVAEGVETAEHLALVIAAGCDQAQGYLFSPPVAACDVGNVLRRCSERLAVCAA